jgi:hypothetical protein
LDTRTYACYCPCTKNSDDYQLFCDFCTTKNPRWWVWVWGLGRLIQLLVQAVRVGEGKFFVPSALSLPSLAHRVRVSLGVFFCLCRLPQGVQRRIKPRPESGSERRRHSPPLQHFWESQGALSPLHAPARAHKAAPAEAEHSTRGTQISSCSKRRVRPPSPKLSWNSWMRFA